MAITVVQTLGAQETAGASSLQSSAFGSAVTSGSTIIVVAAFYATYGTSVTDTAGNTYTKDKDYRLGGGNSTIEIWRASNVTGGSNFKITVNLNVSQYVNFCAVEIAGLDNSSPLSGTGSSNTGSPGTLATTGPFDTADADTIVVAGSSWAGGGSDNGLPTGYSSIAYDGDGTGANVWGVTKIYSSIQTGLDVTASSNSHPGFSWASAAIAYKAAAAAGSPWYYHAQQVVCAGGF